jgi:aminoglycoside 6'-N-acetyltransferase
VVGWIQWSAEEEPDYRRASIDIYVDPAVHGRGVGTDAVRLWRGTSSSTTATTASRSIPPPKPAGYPLHRKVGFQPVGMLHQSGWRHTRLRDTRNPAP